MTQTDKFDHKLVLLQKKVALLEVSSRLAKIAYVPNEFNTIAEETKKQLMTEIKKLDETINEYPEVDSIELSYYLVKSGDSSDETNQRTTQMKELQIDFFFFMIRTQFCPVGSDHSNSTSNPYIIIKIDKQYEAKFLSILESSPHLHTVKVKKISTDEYQKMMMTDNLSITRCKYNHHI